MERKYFGIVFNGEPLFDEQSLIAKLFLSPRISAEHVKRILPLLSKGRVTVDSILKMTDEGINELKTWMEANTDIQPIFRTKVKAWTGIFEPLKLSDYEYLEANYGLTQQMLLGDTNLMQKKRFSSPKELADYVKQYIKGQDAAVEALAVTVYMHLESKRNHYTSSIKTHPLLIGPTGSGKSEMLRIFGLACDCPVIHVNCSDMVAEGWKGRHLSEIFAHTLSDNCTLRDLEYCVIVLHEFDKITHHGQRIVGNNGTDADYDQQSNIMGLFDRGHCIYIDSGFDSGTMSQKLSKLPVDNFLVVLDGAFDGMESIVKKRLHIGTTIGFAQNEKTLEVSNILSYVNDEDLVAWGYMPELIGRIGEIITIEPLSEEIVYQILVSAKESVLRSHIDFCGKNNISLHFSEGALRYLASEAIKSGLGFRNVNKLLFRTMRQIYFERLGSIESGQGCIEVSKEYMEKMLHLKQRF